MVRINGFGPMEHGGVLDEVSPLGGFGSFMSSNPISFDQFLGGGVPGVGMGGFGGDNAVISTLLTKVQSLQAEQGYFVQGMLGTGGLGAYGNLAGLGGAGGGLGGFGGLGALGGGLGNGFPGLGGAGGLGNGLPGNGGIGQNPMMLIMLLLMMMMQQGQNGQNPFGKGNGLPGSGKGLPGIGQNCPPPPPCGCCQCGPSCGPTPKTQQPNAPPPAPAPAPPPKPKKRKDSPLLLDLNGDGKAGVTGKTGPHEGFDPSNPIKFDMFGNGTKQSVEWLKPGGGDGLLAIDKNNNGVIDDRTELFGDTEGYQDGFQKLRTLDQNGDGKISGDELSSLKVWVDSNADGKTDPGELVGVQQLGISSVDAAPSIDPETGALAAFFTQNGETKKLWDWVPNYIG